MLRHLLEALRRRISPSHAYRRAYRQHYGRWPNLRHPRLLSERIYAYKMTADPRMAPLADKVLVKDFVREQLGEDWVIPTIWHGAVLPARDRRDWPLPFIAKANHASGWNAFVRTRADLDWDSLEPRFATWLTGTYGRKTLEPHYKRIAPQILIEPLMGDPQGTPVDYRFHVFGGRVRFIRVHTVHQDDLEETSYDRDWSPQPFRLKKPRPAATVPRPARLHDMIAAAEKLAAGFPFVRVDFFIFEGRPFFGEMTFTPSAGNFKIVPPEYDEILGRLWPRDS